MNKTHDVDGYTVRDDKDSPRLKDVELPASAPDGTEGGDSAALPSEGADGHNDGQRSAADVTTAKDETPSSPPASPSAKGESKTAKGKTAARGATAKPAGKSATGKGAARRGANGKNALARTAPARAAKAALALQAHSNRVDRKLHGNWADVPRPWKTQIKLRVPAHPPQYQSTDVATQQLADRLAKVESGMSGNIDALETVRATLDADQTQNAAFQGNVSRNLHGIHEDHSVIAAAMMKIMERLDMEIYGPLHVLSERQLASPSPSPGPTE